MPMWTCDVEACPGTAVRTLGDCVLCDRHLCSEHLLAPFHGCPKWEDEDAYDPAAQEAETRELTTLIGKINTDALAARASALRGGTPCSIPPLRYDRATRSSVMGGMNYHVEVRFDGGVTWLARIRRFNATSPPAALRDYIMTSEVATLKFLEQTAVASPKVFDFAVEAEDNPVGVGYILMEKLPGRSLRWSLCDQEQKRKVMTGLADVMIELHKYPFNSLGCLDRPGESHVGALHLVLDLISRGEIYSDCAVNAYLIHLFMLDLVPSVLPSSTEGDETRFYLKHADDKGDHILVDDDHNVTGIIDWEWAHTMPPAVAFNSPIGLLHVADFYDGVNTLGDDEQVFAQLLNDKGRPDLADHVYKGRLQHRYNFCCGYDLADWDGFLGLFRGLRDAVKVDQGLDWDAWKARALQRYDDNKELQELLIKGC